MIPKSLGKEPWKIKGLRDQKRRIKVEKTWVQGLRRRTSHRPKGQSLSVETWDITLARVPQHGL